MDMNAVVGTHDVLLLTLDTPKKVSDTSYGHFVQSRSGGALSYMFESFVPSYESFDTRSELPLANPEGVSCSCV
jgi:hypothetical protein